jgi:hypothetical protein
MATAPEIADEEDEDDDETVEPKPPQDTPGARLEEQAPPAPLPSTPHPHLPSIRDAAHLYYAGRYDEAVQTLYLVRRHSPRDADAALWLGHCYFKKLWRTDGLREYDNAIKLQSSLRHDGLLIRNSVSALEDPTYHLARAVIKARIGIAAKAELRRFAHTAKTAKVRARAARLAARVRPIRR